MLYDPKKWDAKADPLSLESLIAWLEQQPPDHLYPATEATNCLLAQWLQSIDPEAKSNSLGRDSFWYDFRGERTSLRKFRSIVLGNDRKRTFGAALERARALHMENQP